MQVCSAVCIIHIATVSVASFSSVSWCLKIKLKSIALGKGKKESCLLSWNGYILEFALLGSTAEACIFVFMCDIKNRKYETYQSNSVLNETLYNKEGELLMNL